MQGLHARRFALAVIAILAVACGSGGGSPTSPSATPPTPLLNIASLTFTPAAGSVLTIGSSAEIVLSTSGGSAQGNAEAVFYVRDDGSTYLGECSSWNGTGGATSWIRPDLSPASAQSPFSFYSFAKGRTINAVVVTAAGAGVLGSCYFQPGNRATDPALLDRATTRRDLALQWRVE